jgi:hypothetical protein
MRRGTAPRPRSWHAPAQRLALKMTEISHEVEDGLGLYEKGPDDRLFVGFYVVVLTFVRFGVNEVIFVNTVKNELGG